MQRWIACYMLYDRNPHHAGSAYLGNKRNWVQQTYKRLDGTAIDAASLNDVLTATFNRILLADVEDFIQTHMKVWKCGRLTVEFQVAKAVAEIYPRQKPSGKPRTGYRHIPCHEKGCLETAAFFKGRGRSKR